MKRDVPHKVSLTKRHMIRFEAEDIKQAKAFNIDIAKVCRNALKEALKWERSVLASFKVGKS